MVKSLNTRQTLDFLRAYESRNITFVEPDRSWPMVWQKARGIHVWDPEGRVYLDLTAAFGVAAAGHANPRVVKAGQQQLARLTHAMGDVHPHPQKARLARELSHLTFERWQPASSGKTIFCNSGFEAVEAALKTAMLATHKPGVIVFEGAYHGLGYGALNATHREHFRSHFVSQLRQFGYFVPFPHAAPLPSRASGPDSEANRGGQAKKCLAVIDQIQRLFRTRRIGAILVEPIQVRGGINIPAAEFLSLLRQLCTEYGVLLILDEIYTGFGRTGKWFACEHAGVVPDLVCLGKALTGGFPLSACVGRADIMDLAWPPSTGEAIHTSTFLGHPVGCAMALAQIEEIRRQQLLQRSADLGEFLLNLLSRSDLCNRSVICSARGLGLLVGLEMRQRDGAPATARAVAAIKSMLHRGYILLPEGEHANVISFTPPLTISAAQLAKTVEVLGQVLRRS